MGREQSDEKTENNERKKRRPSLRDLWRLAFLIIGVVAFVQELQKPPKKRTWHGKVGDLVPYDFRAPTVDRIRATYWNPDGPLLSGKVFGAGWAPNFGAVKRLVAGS